MSTPNQPDDAARRSASSTTEEAVNRQVPDAAQQRAGQDDVARQGAAEQSSGKTPGTSPQLQPRPLPKTGAAADTSRSVPAPTSGTQAQSSGTPTQAIPVTRQDQPTHHSAPEGQRPVQTEQPHAPQHQGPRVQPTPPQRPENQRADTQRLTGGNDRPAGAAAAANPTGPANGRSHQAPTPPWQRGPQSSLNRPGDTPVAGRTQNSTTQSPTNPSTGKTPTHGTSQSPLVTGTAAAHLLDNEQRNQNPEKTARQEAARAKSAGIDGPTRSIARPELAKDMPDLSEVRHPLPVAAEAAPAGAPKKVPGVASVATMGHEDPEAAGLRATVQLRRIDPWSTLKVSLVISVALFFVWMVAVGLLYVVLDGMGVWDRLNSAFTDIVSESSSGGLISAGQVFGYAAVIGLINVILFTALATIGSFIYNQCTDLVGGVQVTLADPD